MKEVITTPGYMLEVRRWFLGHRNSFLAHFPAHAGAHAGRVPTLTF